MNINKTNELTINTDGGSRGNPGPAAIGIVIQTKDKEIIETISKTIGTATNNYAEYTAVKEALSFLDKKLESKTCEVKIEFVLDSELVVRQLTGIYKIKDQTLLKLSQEIKQLATNFANISYTHVRREFNKEADALVNKALDEQ